MYHKIISPLATAQRSLAAPVLSWTELSEPDVIFHGSFQTAQLELKAPRPLLGAKFGGQLPQRLPRLKRCKRESETSNHQI